MATGFDSSAKNSMLQGLKDWEPASGFTAFTFGAFTTDADGALVESEDKTYGTIASGAMDISSNVVINIGASNSITHMRIMKLDTGTGDIYTIYKKDVTTMTFTYAGSITVTSAEISLVDPT